MLTRTWQSYEMLVPAQATSPRIVCLTCDGSGESDTFKACRCCRSDDPPDVRCFERCGACAGTGFVDSVTCSSCEELVPAKEAKAGLCKWCARIAEREAVAC